MPSGPLSPGAFVDSSVQRVGGMFSGNFLAPAVPDSLSRVSLSANSPSFCTSLISLDLIEPLLHLLSVSNVVSVLVGIWVPWVQDMVA